MARCKNCESLVGAPSSVGPHLDLKELERLDYKSQGFRGATRIRYRCTVCATPWERDMDKTDSDAMWETTA